jgi:hypothetical protein
MCRRRGLRVPVCVSSAVPPPHVCFRSLWDGVGVGVGAGGAEEVEVEEERRVLTGGRGLTAEAVQRLAALKVTHTHTHTHTLKAPT